MLMPKKHTKDIYEYLFNEGVLVAKKDVHLAKHPLISTVPNLHVMKCLQSMKSRGYVKEQFAWRHFYWYLTNEGIEYIREYLHLPTEIVPATMKPKARAETQRAKPLQRAGAYEARPYDNRDDYRKTEQKKDDLGLAPGQQMEYRGGAPSSGYGRGFSGYGRGSGPRPQGGQGGQGGY
ncbi:hypothetical protein RvY_09258 [Ramazzottius varieornatus]|uniref:Plectin/eS10 N-terminal domain-containing protein n=1 Tax=Ramazzottius varieornatus TaxID=947166 RepID=A0A1D1VAY3_RAMVA|nr:hypothetical protein RvY_09258 [Ramazzottius varieornatus]